MNFTLRRIQYRDDGVFGELIDHNGIFFCHTLERLYEQEDGSFKPVIMAGEYTCTKDYSPKFDMVLFELQGVKNRVDGLPDHTEIKIHIANYDYELLGCIAIAEGIGKKANGGKMLTHSKKALLKFMNIQKECDKFKLTIFD